MNARKIIEHQLVKNSEIAKIIDVSGSTVITDKLKLRKGNRITEQDEEDIKEFFYYFLKDAEAFDVRELLEIFKLIINVNSDEKADIACDAIERYEKKYMKLGLMDLFL